MLQWFRKQDEENGGKGNGDLHIALIRKLTDFLSSQISTPKRASSILSQISRFKELPPNYQERELPSLYLRIEQYLVEEDPLQKFARPQLRKTVKYRYEPLMELQNFNLIFEPENKQELILSQLLFQNLFMRSRTVLGNADEDFFNRMTEWIYRLPDVQRLAVPFNLQIDIPGPGGDWVPVLARFSQHFFNYLENLTSAVEATSHYEQSYKDLSESFRLLETFSVVVQLLPDKLLDAKKIGLLSGEQIRNVFLNKVEHLKRANDQLSGKNEELQDAQQELQEAQSTALESIKLFHSVLNTISEGIVTADANGNIIMVNEQITNMFGFAEDELIGNSIQTLMPEKYRQQHKEGMARYLRTRESRALGQKLLLEGLRKDRGVFPIEIRITEANIGDQHYFTASMRDLSDNVKQESEHKKASDDLRMAQQRYQNILEIVDDVIFTLSLDGNFTSLNSTFTKLSGWETHAWNGKPFTQWVHSEDSTVALKAFQKVLQGQSTPHTPLRFLSESGETIYGEFTLAPQMQNGKMVGAMGIARDISSQVKSNAALSTHQEEMEELHGQLTRMDERYQRLLEFSSEAILVHSGSKIVSANLAACQLLGASDPDALLHKPYLSFIDKSSRSEERERVNELASQPVAATYTTELTILGMDGRRLTLPAVAERIDFSGHSAVQVIFHNRSAQRAAQQAVEKELVEATNQLQKLQAQRDGVEAEMANLRSEAAYARECQSQAESELESLREKLSSLTELQRTDAEELTQATTALSTIKNEAEAGKAKIKELEQQLASHQEKDANLDFEINQLKTEVDALTAENQQLTASLQQVQEQLENSGAESDIVSKAQAAQAALEREVSSLQAELSFAQNGREAMRAEFENLQKQLETVASSRTALEQELEELRAQPAGSADPEHLESLESQLKIADSVSRDLQEKLNFARKQIDELIELVPICQCKHIRDDQAFWQNLESFAQDPLKATILKEFCPECASKEAIDANEKRNGTI